MLTKTEDKLLIGSIQELPERLGKIVMAGGRELAVFKLSDSTVRAVENRCPHKNGVLSEGMVSGEFVFCPMHDWKISLTDGKVQSPDIGCVQSYTTVVEYDLVFLLME